MGDILVESEKVGTPSGSGVTFIATFEAHHGLGVDVAIFTNYSDGLPALLESKNKLFNKKVYSEVYRMIT